MHRMGQCRHAQGATAQAGVSVVPVGVWCRCDGRSGGLLTSSVELQVLCGLKHLWQMFCREGSDTSVKRGGQAQKQTEGFGKCRSG